MFRDSRTQQRRGAGLGSMSDESEHATERRAAALLFALQHLHHASDGSILFTGDSLAAIFNRAIAGPNGDGHPTYTSQVLAMSEFWRPAVNQGVLVCTNNAWLEAIYEIHTKLDDLELNHFDSHDAAQRDGCVDIIQDAIDATAAAAVAAQAPAPVVMKDA